jgi:hypothetical protein
METDQKPAQVVNQSPEAGANDEQNLQSRTTTQQNSSGAMWICLCVGNKRKWRLNHVKATTTDKYTDRNMFQALHDEIFGRRRRWYWHVLQPRRLKEIKCAKVKQLNT